MIDYIKTDQRTIDLLNAIKDNYPNKDYINVFCDWLEDNGNIEHANFIRTKDQLIGKKYKGTWLGPLYEYHNKFKVIDGLLWQCEYLDITEDTLYFRDSLYEMEHWIAGIHIYSGDKLRNFNIKNLIYCKIDYMCLNDLIEFKIHCKLLIIGNYWVNVLSQLSLKEIFSQIDCEKIAILYRYNNTNFDFDDRIIKTDYEKTYNPYTLFMKYFS